MGTQETPRPMRLNVGEVYEAADTHRKAIFTITGFRVECPATGSAPLTFISYTWMIPNGDTGTETQELVSFLNSYFPRS